MATIAEQWDQAYRSGRWELLRDVSEAPRYGAIAGYLAALAHGGRVLDVGCGEAILSRHLSPAIVREYVGVDCSPTAIDRARRDVSGALPTRLICADIDTFTPATGEAFDAIVFNEVAYYLADPLDTLARYAQHLTPDGLIVLSMYAHNRRGEERMAATVSRIWRALERAPEWIAADDVMVSNVRRDIRWRIWILRYQKSIVVSRQSTQE